MHCDIDEEIYVKLEGPMAELLVRLDPDKYSPFLTKEHGKSVIYIQLLKALYGTLQATLLFWEKLSGFLIDELGFAPNPYDSCIVNKTINGHQCTAVWHVNDNKRSSIQSLKDSATNIGKSLLLQYTRELSMSILV
jgi:hypothetical protein